MPDVDYLVIAVRSEYRDSNDFDKVRAFIDWVETLVRSIGT